MDGSVEAGAREAQVVGDRGPDLRDRDRGIRDTTAPATPWVFLAGGRTGRVGSYQVVVEGTGHVLAFGSSTGDVPFGPAVLPHGGVLGVRLSPSGKLDWVKGITPGGNSFGPSICVDSAGRIVVAGSFSGVRSFGTKTLTSQGNTDTFVAWLDTKGGVLSAISLGGQGWDGPAAIGCDTGGNIYVAGTFDGPADFGSATLTPAGSDDVFVCKLDAQGNVVWAVRGGGPKLDAAARSIVVDQAGNTLIAVNFWGSATFGSIELEPKSAHDSAVLKLDSTGKFLWASQGSGDVLYFTGLATDGAGNAYLTGNFNSAARIGQKALRVAVSSSGATNGMLAAKLSPSGAVQWAVAVGEAEGRAIAVDAAGNSYITGGYTTFVSSGPFGLPGMGSSDIFVAKLGPNRTWLGAVSAGGKLGDFGHAITLDGAGNIYVSGVTHYDPTDPSAVNQGTVTFGKQTFQLDGAEHMFVWKLPAGQL